MDNKLFVKRVIVSSGRIVSTVEYRNESNLFYVVGKTTSNDTFSVNGPFRSDDKRFELLKQ